MDAFGKPNLRVTTYETYATYIRNHIKPEIGNISVARLQPLQLQRLYARKLEGGQADGQGGGLSSNSVACIHKIMSRALAVKWEMIAKNVAEAVIPPRIQKKSQATSRPLTALSAFLISIAVFFSSTSKLCLASARAIEEMQTGCPVSTAKSSSTRLKNSSKK